MARALVDGGASLEARARSRATTFNDPIFPMLGGTPLVWAVAADSPIAVSTLIDLGADPFDEAAQAAPTSDRWTEFNHLSPVVVAAARHQHEIIRALFPPERRAATPNLGNRLNNVRIRMGSQGALTSFSLFSICARYDIEGLLPRVLLHGRDHKIAFKCTFELLIDLGADPLDTQHDGAVIIGHAVHAGQPFVLDYLMQWRGGILHNDRPMVWYEMMCRAARDEDRVIFDTLLKYEIADQISVEEWGQYLALMARETNDPYFLDPFADKIRAAGDLGPHLSVALDAGNFETARWIYGVAASCDLVQPVEGLSLLGRILLKSRRFFTLHSAVSAVLALPGVPERVFDNAMELGGSQLTVLHVAALHLEYHPDSTMATRVFEEVADVFYEPEQLNAQPASGVYEGYSPLHFAIEYGNAGAARRLLREVDSGLNPNVVNGRGETAVDVLLRQFTSQERRFDMFDVPAQRRRQLGMCHWEHTLEVLATLRNAGGHHRKYVQAVLRPSEDLLFIYDLRRNQPFLEVTCKSTQPPSPAKFVCVI